MSSKQARDDGGVRLTVLVDEHRPALPTPDDLDIRYVRSDQLSDALRDADVLLIWDFKAIGVKEAVRASRRLRWIHVSSVGVDRVLDDDLRRRDITMTNCRGVLEGAMAEYVLGLLLALVKDLHGSIRQQEQHVWRHRPTARLAGHRSLIVGVGAIGTATARMLRAAGVDVDGVGRRPRTTAPPFGTVYAHTDLARVVTDYDSVIVTAPLTPQTQGMINAETLRAMDSEAFLINVGRGELVDQAALVNVLRDRGIAAAALDVFATEPLPYDDPLWAMPNVIVSPHMAGDYVGWRDDLLQVFLDNLDRYRTGRPLLNVVDKELGYVPVSAHEPAEREKRAAG